MAISWRFNTKKEALKKLGCLKKPDTYEIIQSRRADGKFTKGWVLRKRK